MQLKEIMDNDPEMAEMYQEAFTQEKMDREVDIQRFEDVHERFGKVTDKKRMKNRIKDPRFDDLEKLAQDTEDEAFTTDFEDDVDPQDQEIYKMYKLIYHEGKEDEEEAQ